MDVLGAIPMQHRLCGNTGRLHLGAAIQADGGPDGDGRVQRSRIPIRDRRRLLACAGAGCRWKVCGGLMPNCAWVLRDAQPVHLPHTAMQCN